MKGQNSAGSRMPDPVTNWVEITLAVRRESRSQTGQAD